jgi:hypothetical protein
MQRIQFEIAEDRWRELEHLMRKAKMATKKELLTNALTLFEWVLSEVEQGNAIASVDPKHEKYKEITMPAFRHIAPKRSLVPA